jgi:hypothetical protein
MTTRYELMLLSASASGWCAMLAAHSPGANFVHLPKRNVIGTTTTTNAARSNLDGYAPMRSASNDA